MEEFGQVTLKLLGGFSSSVFLFVLTLLLSLPLGLLMSFGTMSRFLPLRYLSRAIVMVLRGTPLLLQIFVIFYVPGLLWGFQWPSLSTGNAYFDTTFSNRFFACLAAFSVNYAAYFSEIFRGGIQSIPKGQYEAGEVLGMSKGDIFKKVILLQMVKRVIPPLGNEVVTLVKDTALANAIAVTELMFQAQQLLNAGLIYPIFYAGAFYFLFNALVSFALRKTEERLAYIAV
ncbi:MAG: amino acid ABC transporter permease [Bacilli bacterium]|nr:amino acid ABC transporter permease [Bacilli bacterium]